MRLQPKEVDAIVQAARDAFVPGTAVFLFGPRLQRVGRNSAAYCAGCLCSALQHLADYGLRPNPPYAGWLPLD